QYVEQIIAIWPKQQRETAIKIIGKYRLPQEATASRLIWYNNGRWKCTIVHRDAVPHHFPTTHPDFLEQTICYYTPVNKFDEIAMFDGSTYPDRTRGEVTAICDKEEFNTLNINMLHDIVTCKRTVNNAREFATATIANYLIYNISSPYFEGFLFPQQTRTADPDIQKF
ncbi:hypothetical protein ACOI1C_22610, partial [Bacillus sp. DJP31]|uniref:hypothetical protein n=1 Tax=Bacillus sp. DJP31 TaxID=3409789 RepID=UPI003BB75D70